MQCQPSALMENSKSQNALKVRWPMTSFPCNYSRLYSVTLDEYEDISPWRKMKLRISASVIVNILTCSCICVSVLFSRAQRYYLRPLFKFTSIGNCPVLKSQQIPSLMIIRLLRRRWVFCSMKLKNGLTETVFFVVLRHNSHKFNIIALFCLCSD